MTWYPLFVHSDNLNCLVVGGGRIALHKLRVLEPGHFRLIVVAPEVLPEIEGLPAELRRRRVEEQDLDGMQMVIDATGDPEVGAWLAECCARRGLLLNVVDCPVFCNFIFPAVLWRGKFVAAISSSGASPTAAAWARDQLDAALPEQFEAILDQLEGLRPETRNRLPEQSRRSRFLKRCFTCAIERERPLTQDELDSLWAEEL